MWKALMALFGRSKMRREVLLSQDANGTGSNFNIEDNFDITLQIISTAKGVLPLPVAGTWTIEITQDDPSSQDAKWSALATGSGSAIKNYAGHSFAGMRASIANMANSEIRVVFLAR